MNAKKRVEKGQFWRFLAFNRPFSGGLAEESAANNHLYLTIFEFPNALLVKKELNGKQKGYTIEPQPTYSMLLCSAP